MKNSDAVGINPDGNIVYLEKYNPYKAKCSHDKPIEQGQEGHQHIQINEEDLYMATDLILSALDLEKKAKFVKIICIFDGAVSIINLGMRTPYAVISFVASICGFQGASMYNRPLLMVYISYQMLEIFAKVYILFIITQLNMLLFMGLSIGIDMYIMKEFLKFYKMLPY